VQGLVGQLQSSVPLFGSEAQGKHFLEQPTWSVSQVSWFAASTFSSPQHSNKTIEASNERCFLRWDLKVPQRAWLPPMSMELEAVKEVSPSNEFKIILFLMD